MDAEQTAELVVARFNALLDELEEEGVDNTVAACSLLSCSTQNVIARAPSMKAAFQLLGVSIKDAGDQQVESSLILPH